MRLSRRLLPECLAPRYGLAVALAWACCGFLAPATPAQQRLSLDAIVQQLDEKGSVALGKGQYLALTFDYTFDDARVEAIAFRPAAEGTYPGVLLIPGYSRSARDYIPIGLQLARAGYAAVAITQPGFGRSDGPADFVGPGTIATLEAGFQRFRHEPYVDRERMGLFGYSRGGMAAALLAVKMKDSGLLAAVFGAGIYDFKLAYDEIADDEIRANMEAEAGLTAEAIRRRTSVPLMENLVCPVLILHGAKDVNAPVSQAFLLRDRLAELDKEFEIKIFPDRDHDIGRENLYDSMLDFFARYLLPPGG